MNQRRFGPIQHGERFLAFVLALAAAGLVYLAVVYFPFFTLPDRGSRGGLYLLLLAGVFLLGSFAAWRWKPMQSELAITEDGLRFKSTGQFPVGDTQLAWHDIATIEHRVVMRPKGSDLRFLVFIAGSDAAKPGRAYRLITNGLEADVPVVMQAIIDGAAKNGWRAVGPRVDHVASWFDGVNWRLEKG